LIGKRRNKVKTFFVLTVAAVLALPLAGCASAPKSAGASAPLGKGLGGVPAFVNDAYLNASEDVLIGVGTYKIGNDMSRMGTGKTFAETRARADVSRQLSTIVKNMVNDYTAVSEIDPSAALSFQETITQSLSKSELRGAKAIKIDTDGNGLLWVVIEYSKSAAANEVNQAVNAAKLAVPAAATFNALERMNTAFDKEAGGGPVPVGD
jgi:predicted outer membrane protein